MWLDIRNFVHVEGGVKVGTYRNVDAELKRIGKTRGSLAEYLNINQSTLSFKLNGKSIITLAQALEVKKFLGTDMPLEELFKVSA